MTFRMSLLRVALATSTLIVSDVMAARAATKFCDIYPERCQYGTDGLYYYYPLGYRMPGSVVTRPTERSSLGRVRRGPRGNHMLGSEVASRAERSQFTGPTGA